MLKTLVTKSAELREDVVGVGSDSKAGQDRNKLDKSKIDSSEIDSGEDGDNEVKKKIQKTSKFKNLSKSKETVRSNFFTSGARLTFTKL